MESNANPSIPHRTVSTIRTSESTGGNVGSGAGRSGSGGGGGAGYLSGASKSGQAAPTTPGAGGAGSAYTPMRTTPSAYMSPGSIRAEEQFIVIEFGARQLRIGLAAEPVPRIAIPFGPEHQRRVGDLRVWDDNYVRDWRHAGEDGAGTTWDTAFELWQLDMRSTDLGLVSDKLERALREGLTKYLMIDSRPRRFWAVIPPALPLPLISTIMETLFSRFQSPTVTLMSSPVASTVAAGLRHALVVDIGWNETIVTSIFEYHEVAMTRSVRAGRMLVQDVHDLLAGELSDDYKSGTEERRGASTTAASRAPPAGVREHLVSFEECEEVATRVVWCRQTEGLGPSRSNAAARPASDTAVSASASISASASASKPAAAEAPEAVSEDADADAGLATVTETDETEDAESTYSSAKSRSSTPPPPPPKDGDNNNRGGHSTTGTSRSSSRTTRIPLRSCAPPTTLTMSFDKLAEPCETTFMGGTGEGRDNVASWDDNELPIPLLIYQHLLNLPLDVRAICMSRILFTGGCTKVLGLRARIFDEVARISAELGWDGVRGKAVGQYKANTKLRRDKKRRGGAGSAGNAGDDPRPQTSDSAESADPVWHDAANAAADVDPVEGELRKTRQRGDSTAPHMPGMQPLQPTGQTMGELRAVETLGAYGGASVLAALRIPGLVMVDRDQWIQQGGITGAVRPADMDWKVLQRHSIIPNAGLRSYVGGPITAPVPTGPMNWTLGPWGAV